MFLPILSFILGLVLLIWSAGRFVVGASALAKYCGLSSFLIGMIVVGFGTSAPELAVSLFAALGGSPELALGNAYGSNIGNIALILGFTAIIFPIVIPKSAIRMDIPIISLLQRDMVVASRTIRTGRHGFAHRIMLLATAISIR